MVAAARRNDWSDEMIIAADISKRFGKIQAVEGLSLNVRQGETLGLLGPNGAGKTTTINMLVGLLQPDSGTVTIGPGRGGQSGSPTQPSVRAMIGVAPQSLAIYDELTASENLSFFGRLYGLRGNALSERVDWALEFSGLTDRRKHRVGTYSGGMKRRLNLAVALIHEPEIVLLDEPTVGVDPQSRNHLFECIERLQKDGLTLLYTTHYMEEAQRLCNRVAIIDHGKLLAIDSVSNLIAAYGTRPVIEGELLEANGVSFPEAEVDGQHFRLESAEPVQELGRLVATGLKFQQVSIHQPDLESVFLALTGRRLRDE